MQLRHTLGSVVSTTGLQRGYQLGNRDFTWRHREEPALPGRHREYENTPFYF